MKGHLTALEAVAVPSRLLVMEYRVSSTWARGVVYMVKNLRPDAIDIILLWHTTYSLYYEQVDETATANSQRLR